MTYFREVQHIRRPWLVALLLAVAAFGFYWLLRAQAVEKPLGFVYDFTLWVNIGVTCLFVLWIWFARLETAVRDDSVHLRFYWVWRPKAIPFESIEGVEAYTYRPIRDYGGWGVRGGKGESIWNAYGNGAVRLRLTDGKRFCIGSQQPEKLAEAIRQRLATGMATAIMKST